MSRWCWGLVCLALCFGCTIPNPANCSDGTCTDPALPFCDVGGEVAGHPLTCIAVSCTPLEFETCRNDDAVICNSVGTSFDVVQCELGCDAAAGGCQSRCTANTDCSLDEPVCRDGTCETCSGDTDCEARADTPRCHDGTCVECVTSADCPASSPTCDDSRCRTCRRDADCDSGACASDGTCVPESAILYVSSVNGVNTSCTRAQPCASPSFAVDQATATRSHVVILGGGTFTARLARSLLPFEIFVHGHGSTLLAQDGRVQQTNVIAFGRNRFTLREVTVSGETRLGSVVVGDATLESVTIVNATHLHIRGQTVARNLTITGSIGEEAILLDLPESALTIDGGRITGGEVGIRVTAPGARVELNNVLISRTRQRALELGPAVGKVEFTTIADSGADLTEAPCSVVCTPSLRVTSSIIWQETCSGRVRDAAGPCTFASSIVSNSSGTGFTNVNPLFVDRLSNNYHLQATSPAKDLVDEGPRVDFEGDPRPRGVRFDIGVDEAP